MIRMIRWGVVVGVATLVFGIAAPKLASAQDWRIEYRFGRRYDRDGGRDRDRWRTERWDRERAWREHMERERIRRERERWEREHRYRDRDRDRWQYRDDYRW